MNQEISTLAVSLSTNALKFYAPATGQYLGECTGHTGSIHEIAFSAPSSLQVICSCSGDGTIRAWDTRSFKQRSGRSALPPQGVHLCHRRSFDDAALIMLCF
uniref:Uncharacterized protein n=1 Tax=Aegilops tauschii subsp. strangulata TaxID=200361 RepID=A0A453FD88_AEGTS